jgi:hypothetical protein
LSVRSEEPDNQRHQRDQIDKTDRIDQMDQSFIRAVAHAGAVKKGQFNLTGSQLGRKVRA